MRRIRLLILTAFASAVASLARADISSEITQASAPISEGVPEVAAVRLQSLLNNNLSEAEWRAVVEKLAEAQMAAKEPEDTLILLADPRLRNLPWANFWRAQALASIQRWAEALPLYDELTNEGSPFRKAAVFASAEALRALGKPSEALRRFLVLVQDNEWGTRAQLRAADLYIELGDAPRAGRLL